MAYLNVSKKDLSKRDHTIGEVHSWTYEKTFLFTEIEKNCKLLVVNNITRISNSKKDYELFKEALEHTERPMILITAITKDVIKIIGEDYEIFYLACLPTGYSGGSQYHCCFWNHNSYINDERIANEKKLTEWKTILEEMP